MAREREVKVTILGEDRSASKALKGVADAADKVGPSGKVASNALDSVTSALTNGLGPAAGPAKDALDKVGTSALSSGGLLKTAVAGGAVVAGLALAKFALDGVAGATSLNESLSKSNTIFEEHGKGIEKWASGGARDFGLAKGAALEAAGSFGNLFTQLDFGKGQAADMSTTMVELAADFASFHNADITEVIQAQTAAFRGEYDAVQRFVPTINAAAVEQKALEMQLAATKGELTDQDKALAAYTLMVEGAGKATGDFDRTSGGLANQQRILKAQVENLQNELGSELIPVLTELGALVIPLISGVSDLADKVGGLGGIASNTAKAVVPFLGVLDLLPGKSKKAGDETDKHAESAEGLAGEMDVLTEETAKAEAATVDIAKETEKARKEAEKYEKKIDDMAGTVAAGYSLMSGRSVELTQKQKDLARGMDTAKSSADQLKAGMDLLVGVHISAQQAAIRWEEAIAGTSAKLRENKATLDITTEAGRENQTVIISMIQAALGHVDALQREGASSDRVTAAYHDHVAALRRVMEQAGYSKQEIEALLGRYNLLAAAPDINKNVTTTFTDVYVVKGDRLHGGSSTAGIGQYAIGMEMGPIPGSRNEMVPILAHGGEWVVTPEQMARLKGASAVGSDGAWALAGGGGMSIAPGAIIIYALDPKAAALGVRDELISYGKRVPTLGLT